MILGGSILTGLFPDSEQDIENVNLSVTISALLLASGFFRAILLILAGSLVCQKKAKERRGRMEPRLSVNTSTSRDAGAVY